MEPYNLYITSRNTETVLSVVLTKEEARLFNNITEELYSLQASNMIRVERVADE